jgi:hypothetical protein
MALTKERILSEIRGLAAENGGVAPGAKIFKRATGTKESDWRGRHWVNWGQALTEAGYAPNSWVQAIPEDELLANLAGYVRLQGRYPVDSELKIVRQKNPDVPNPQVLRRRFGSSQATADALLRYARKEGDQKLIAICEARVAVETHRPTKPQKSAIVGSVYLMKSGQFYKIGLSNASGRREYEIGIQLPERLKIVHEIKTDCPEALEKYWHDRFEAKRKNGEWFDLEAKDIKAFSTRKQFFFGEIFS